MKVPKKLDEAPKGEWFLLHGKEGRFYTKQRRCPAYGPSVLCVDKEGEPVAEMMPNMSGGIAFATYMPLSDLDILTVFNVLKAEVPKP